MAKTPITPVSHPAAPVAPRWVVRECLAGIVTALALVPEVISFSVIAGVDPKVSLLSSIVLCLVTSLLGGRRAMVTAAAGSVALVIGPMVHVHGVAYIAKRLKNDYSRCPDMWQRKHSWLLSK